MMIIAIAQSDAEMAAAKEGRILRPVLHAFTEAEHDTMEDITTVAERFRSNLQNEPLCNHLNVALKHTWAAVSVEDLEMLVEYTVWHAAPALAWRRLDSEDTSGEDEVNEVDEVDSEWSECSDCSG